MLCCFTSRKVGNAASVSSPQTPNTKARIISKVDFDSKTFHLTTQNLSYDVWGFSHRWEDRSDADSWKVICGKETYTCLMYPHEVENIQMYLDNSECSGLWLDYVCINQNDEKDKCAQVGIMGTLYMSITSLVVGKGLAPIMPSIDYTDRAWCVQERMFGKIRFPQNFEKENEEHVQKFAHDMISRLPGLYAVMKYTLKDACHWDWGEEWRLDCVRGLHGHEMYKDCTDLLDEIVKSIQNEDAMRTSILALKIRENVIADLNIDQKEWTLLMNSCSATYQHDRLYGLWGVPMNAKDTPMPYDDPNKALSLLHENFPQSCFSYPPGGKVDEVSYKIFPDLDIDSGIATVHQLTMQKFEVECKEEFKSTSSTKSSLLVDITIGREVYAYDMMHMANDVKFRIVADKNSIALAYDDPPESDVNRTLRLVFGLTFWKDYKDHADKMPKGEPLANLFESAFYRRHWDHEGGIWTNNRNFWGLGDNDWKWKFRVMEYVINLISNRENDSPLHPYVDQCRK